MKIEFIAKYGINEVELPINGGIKLRFNLKYGKNVISIPTTNETISFVAKYGKNSFEIPDTMFTKDGGKFFTKRITIYNDIPSDGVNPRRFERKVINLCNIQKGTLQSADGTIERVVNATTIISKDVERYKPFNEFVYLPQDEQTKYFTANVNDFVVFDEVDDVVATSREFQELQTKYKHTGVSVTSVNEFINGMSIDNVQIIHA